MEIHTHQNVDLDAVASVWAIQTFAEAYSDAAIYFHPANWDGASLNEDIAVAVDIEAGGKGVKGKKDKDGTVHSCFATIISKLASKEDQQALAPLVDFIDAQDAHGSAVKFLAPEVNNEAQQILSLTGINAVLRSFQAIYPGDDKTVIDCMSEIFDGMLKAGRSRLMAKVEAAQAEILPGNNVAILRNMRYFATPYVLFEQGIKAIVYVDGHSLGVFREGSQTERMDHPKLRAIVEQQGELEEWFAHSSGFLFSRGTRKAPATSPSKVNPFLLAQTANSLFS